jgi:hypothetical protein
MDYQTKTIAKRTCYILLISLFCLQGQKAFSQNRLCIETGFLGSYTSIAEYERIERHDFLLDSVRIDRFIPSFQAALRMDIGLGKHLFFTGGLHYSQKGLSSVDFTDSTGYTWTTPARQHYTGLSMLLGYEVPVKNSKISLNFATGFQADFAVGTPNGGALFSGPLYRFFMPFCRFNEVDFTWRTEAGLSWDAGPGAVLVKLTYQYGLSDVLEDAFIIGRSQSIGIAVGYALRLSDK